MVSDIPGNSSRTGGIYDVLEGGRKGYISVLQLEAVFRTKLKSTENPQLVVFGAIACKQALLP